jgi:peroxiredoxin
MTLKPGDEAPDFELRSHRGGTVKLSSFRGKKNVVLAFHPLAFTPVCANQMSGYQSELSRFDAADAAILGISIDAQPAKAAWATSLGSVSYDLLSDFYPHGEVARQYGVLRPEGFSERAVFVIDKAGKIVWSTVYDIPTLPALDDTFAALEKLR